MGKSFEGKRSLDEMSKASEDPKKSGIKDFIQLCYKGSNKQNDKKVIINANDKKTNETNTNPKEPARTKDRSDLIDRYKWDTKIDEQIKTQEEDLEELWKQVTDKTNYQENHKNRYERSIQEEIDSIVSYREKTINNLKTAIEDINPKKVIKSSTSIDNVNSDDNISEEKCKSNKELSKNKIKISRQQQELITSIKKDIDDTTATYNRLVSKLSNFRDPRNQEMTENLTKIINEHIAIIPQDKQEWLKDEIRERIIGTEQRDQEFRDKVQLMIEKYNHNKHNGKKSLKEYFTKELGIFDYRYDFMRKRRSERWHPYRWRRKTQYEFAKLYSQIKNIKDNCDKEYVKSLRANLQKYSEAGKIIKSGELDSSQIETICKILSDKKYARGGMSIIDAKLLTDPNLEDGKSNETHIENNQSNEIPTQNNKSNTLDASALQLIIQVDQAVRRGLDKQAKVRLDCLNAKYTANIGISANTALTGAGAVGTFATLAYYGVYYASFALTHGGGIF